MKSLPFWMGAFVSTLIFLAGSSVTIQAVEPCINLADEPLEIASMGAPGMIMVVYDNSGSMEFTMMTPETEGSFHTPSQNGYYGYCFLYDPDYGSNDLPTLQGSGDELYWKSQWHGYNTIYYNPTVLYEPWPAWTEVEDVASIPAGSPQANPTNPLTNVVKYSNTFNLDQTWKEVTVGGGTSIDDLIASGAAIVVDNTDTRAVDSIYVDDEGDGNNVPGFSFTRDLWRWNRFDDWNYYDGDYMNYYGDSNPLPVTATWMFDVLTAGNYEVWASVSKYSTRTRNANYTITHQGGNTVSTISQRINGGPTQDWVSLGDYDFNAGIGAGKVVLNFTTTQQGASISVDAIELRPTFTIGSPVKYFESTGPWGVSTAAADYGPNYLWTPQINETYTAKWTATNLTQRADYDVYARWVGVPQRSNNVRYTVDGTTVGIDQRYNSGVWTLLKEDANFGNTTTGFVSLTHTCDSTDWDRACADAVAFVPASGAAGSNVKIIIAHYFVQNENGTYLVNLDGTIKYYQITDADLDSSGVIEDDERGKTLDGDGKVENGELVEMTLDQATAAGIVSGRSYADERQNFANWFQFARSRNHVSKFALGTLVQRMGNIYFGFTTIPSRDIYSLRAIRESKVIKRDDTLLILNNIYNLANPNGGTPIKDGYVKVGNFFEYTTSSLVSNADKQYFMAGGYSDEASFPYLNQANGGNCQQAFMIAMTDGWYNSNTASNIGDFDADGPGPWDGGEFADGYSGTLADISMDLYERDMKPDNVLTDDVPTNKYDNNNEQHVVTYALAFGTKGTIDPEADEWVNCPYRNDTTQSCGTWPFPVSSTATTIDDLYHSTVNGRGLFLNAGNPQELVAALMKIKENIEERLGSSAAVSTNSVQRQIGSKLYRGEYLTGKWSGDLKAFDINVNTGAVYTTNPVWSAAAKLDELTTYTGRNIYTLNDTTGIGVDFEFDQLSDGQKTRLADGLTYAFGTTAAYAFGTVDTVDVTNLVNYLKGDTSNDQAHGGPFRSRANLLGDIVHSEAEYYNRVLYVGANDGMLHAVHSETGVELGAYVPSMLYDELPKLAYPQYQHQYFVNNTPSVTNTGTQKLLACTMGKGYKGLFVLDVTTPMGEADASKVGLWEYPGTGVIDPDLGYTYSYASIVNTNTGTAADRWVVIIGNGYDSTNGHAVLYIFDALTGAVLKKIDTGVGGCNGLSSPAIIDPDGNGRVDYAYAGDLKGNMWKFDLTGNAVSDWKIAFNDGTNPQPLIKVMGPTGNTQPITNMPGVMFVSKCNPPGSKGFLVVFGTGQYLGIPDLSNTSDQSVYGVYDWGPDWEIKTGDGTDANKHLGTFGTDRTLANATTAAGKAVSLIQQTVSITTSTVNGETYRFISNNPVNYYNVELGNDPANGDAMGYYVDLPDSGERMVRRPIIRNNVFMFVANKPEGNVCSAGGTSVLYMLDACTGGWPALPQFDTDGDGDFDDNDLINGQTPIGLEYDSMLLDITILDNTAYTPPAGNINEGEDGTGKMPDLDVRPRPGARFWQIIE